MRIPSSSTRGPWRLCHGELQDGARFCRRRARGHGGAGANLVLDPVGGGSHMAQNCRAIATEGRWVLYGLMGGIEPQGALLGTILRKRTTIRGTTLRARLEYKAALIEAFSQHALPKLADGSYVVQIDRAFDLNDVNAHELMESNATLGKIVLNVSHDE